MPGIQTFEAVDMNFQVFVALWNIIALWKNDMGTFCYQVHDNQKDQDISEEIDI